MDLKTNYLGMTLNSPLVPSASPLSESIDNIKKMEDNYAGAVVLYSIFEEQIKQQQHELNYFTTAGTESFAESLTYFPEPFEYKLGPDEYLEHINKAKEAVKIPIIASINGCSLEGWTDYARNIQQAGADALELNIYNIPTNSDVSGSEIEDDYIEIIKAVKSIVSIPLAVKLSPYFSNFANMASRIDEIGVKALVLFNRFYQPDINLENMEVYPNLLLSQPSSQRLAMRWIAILKNKIKADFAATSGIYNATDVAKMLLVGANATMLCSAFLVNGIDYISILRNDLIRWLEEKEYTSVMQMQGSMSQQNINNPSAYERAQYMKAITYYKY